MRRPVGVAAQHGGVVLGATEGADPPRTPVSDPKPKPFSKQARYPARSVPEAMFSRRSGRSRKPLWSIRASATATTSADLGMTRVAAKIAGVHNQQFMEITAPSPRRFTAASSGFSTSSARLPSASAVASANAAIS